MFLLRDKVAELGVTISELRADVSHLEQREQSLQDRNTQLERNLQSLEDQKEELGRQISVLLRQNTTLEQQKSQLQDQNNLLEQQGAQHVEERNETGRRIAQLELRLQGMSADAEGEQSRLEAAEANWRIREQDLLLEVDSLRNAARSIIQQTEREKNAWLLSVEKEKEMAVERADKLERDLEDARKIIKILSAEKNARTDEREDLTGQISALGRQLAQEASEVEGGGGKKKNAGLLSLNCLGFLFHRFF